MLLGSTLSVRRPAARGYHTAASSGAREGQNAGSLGPAVGEDMKTEADRAQDVPGSLSGSEFAGVVGAL
jgi:hypothetical protein